MPDPKFKIGDEVQAISDPARIGTVISVGLVQAGVQWYTVNFGGLDRPTVPENDLRPYMPSPKPIDNLVNGQVGRYREFQRLITYQRLYRENPLHNTLYAINASRTRFFPYQFRPIMKILDSPRSRLLLADEVGLGKTIEAGLILTEMQARQKVKRVLVVCPANLCEKWQVELETRFGESFSVLKTKDFMKLLEKYTERPEATEIKSIISLESIRQTRVLEALEAISPDLDITIVDEAHHMRNIGRKQRKAGILLSGTSSMMLLLTATPVHLGSQDLFSLLNILDEAVFPDSYTAELLFKDNEPLVKCQICFAHTPPNLEEANKLLEKAGKSQWVIKNPLYKEVTDQLRALTDTREDEGDYKRRIVEIQRSLAELNLIGHILNRTRKREVRDNFPERKAHPIQLTFTPIEREFYDAVTQYVRYECSKRGYSARVQTWMLHMPQRRAASSIPAMVEYYRNQFGLDEKDRPEDERFEEEDNSAQVEFDGDVFQNARERLKKIVNKWPENASDSKYDAFVAMLQQLKNREDKCKVMVFAFFKGTLKYLHRRLSADGFSSKIISGDVKPTERKKIISEFKDKTNINVLLSSRVGSEGLDFQFCDTMFNYDLPWNPMEVEQRIGRLDRLGQEAQVIRIYNFWIEGTIEEKILSRLYQRIGIFERSIGELEAILGDEIKTLESLESDLLENILTEEQVSKKIECAANIMLKRIKDLEDLEKSSAKFIGTEQFFDEEIKTILNRKRYVTSEQMRKFVLDFLRYECPQTRLEYEKRKTDGLLFPDRKFQELVSRRTSGLSHLLGQTGVGIPITFDATTAFNKPNIEFINTLHPITRMIIEYYKSQSKLLQNASHVSLQSKDVDFLLAGKYFYFIFRVRIHAAHEKNTLETIIIDQKINPVCSLDEGEIVLSAMLENGADPTSDYEIKDRNAAFQAHQVAEKLLLDRIGVIRIEEEKINNIFVNRRLKSLGISYDKNIENKKALLTKGTEERKDERYLRMLKGTVNRLEEEIKDKTQNLENLRKIQVEYNEIAAGILEII